MLARVAGFREKPSSSLCTLESHGASQVALLDEVPGALAGLVAAIGKANAARLNDLGLVVAGIATARGAGYRLLVDAGAVPALLRHLPRCASMGVALAVERLAIHEEGQDALCAAGAAPLLRSAAFEAEGAAAAELAFTLGLLASHESARTQLVALGERAANDDHALQLYAMAALNIRGWFAMRESAMRLLQTVSTSPLSQGALLLLRAIGENGTPDQKERLVASDTFDALVQSAESDSTGWAWAALSVLVKSEQGRKRALALELPRRLHAALTQRGCKVAYQASLVINELSSVKGSKSAAVVMSTDGVIAALSQLIGTSREDHEARFMSDASASSLKRMVESAAAGHDLTPLAEKSPAMTPVGVLQRAAAEALEPTIALLSSPPVEDVRTENVASLTSVLAKGTHGCELARGALERVLRGDGVEPGARLRAAALLRERLLSPCYDNGLWEPSRDYGRELVSVASQADSEPEVRMAALLVLHSLPDFESAVAHELIGDATAVHALVALLDIEGLDVAHMALRPLCVMAKLPGGYEALVDAGALLATVTLMQAPLNHYLNCLDVLSAILGAAESAGGEERARVADAIVALGAVPLLEAQIAADPLLRRSTTADGCELLTHLARTEAGAQALAALIEARAVCAVRKVVTTRHARAAAIDKGGLTAALRVWLEGVDGMSSVEREATLGLVSDLAAARDVSTEAHVLPLVPLVVRVLQSVVDGRVVARDASAVAAMKLVAAVSGERAGVRTVHGAGVLPLVLPLVRAGSAAGEGAYLTEGGTVVKRALADAEARSAGVGVVEALVAMLPAAAEGGGGGFDPFDAADARLAAKLLVKLVPGQALAAREAGAVPRLAIAASADAFVAPRRLSQLATEMLASLLRQHPVSSEVTRATLQLLVQSADGGTAPHDARVAFFKDPLPSLGGDARRHMAEACLDVLALPGVPDALQDAAARRLLDEPERALRADVLTRWCQTLRVSEGDVARRTARVLLRVGPAELDAVPSALGCVLAALGDAPAVVARDLAAIVRAIAVAREKASGYRLLLDGGAVRALLRQLPHEAASVSVAHAIAKLAATDDGQDELLRAKAAPQLLAAALEATEDEAAADAARALARLAVHADGRVELSKLAERAANDERALRLLGLAVLESTVCARAVAAPAMQLVAPALASRAPVPTARAKTALCDGAERRVEAAPRARVRRRSRGSRGRPRAGRSVWAGAACPGGPGGQVGRRAPPSHLAQPARAHPVQELGREQQATRFDISSHQLRPRHVPLGRRRGRRRACGGRPSAFGALRHGLERRKRRESSVARRHAVGGAPQQAPRRSRRADGARRGGGRELRAAAPAQARQRRTQGARPAATEAARGRAGRSPTS